MKRGGKARPGAGRAFAGVACLLVLGGCTTYSREELRRNNDLAQAKIEEAAAASSRAQSIARVYAEAYYEQLIERARNQLDGHFVDARDAVLVMPQTATRAEVSAAVNAERERIGNLAESIASKRAEVEAEADATQKAAKQQELQALEAEQQNVAQRLAMLLEDLERAPERVTMTRRDLPNPLTTELMSALAPLLKAAPDRSARDVASDAQEYNLRMDHVFYEFTDQMGGARSLGVRQYRLAIVGGTAGDLGIPPGKATETAERHAQAWGDVEAILSRYEPLASIQRNRAEVLAALESHKEAADTALRQLAQLQAAYRALESTPQQDPQAFVSKATALVEMVLSYTGSSDQRRLLEELKNAKSEEEKEAIRRRAIESSRAEGK